MKVDEERQVVSCRFLPFRRENMRYFSDEKLKDMREQVRLNYDENESKRYLAWITRIEMLDRRNDEYGDCRNELLQAITALEQETERYVHRGIADPNDEDNDAFEYENF